MIRAEDRRRLRAIYVARCGYCGLSETDIGSELTIDHFQPRSFGGSDALENLVYACHACNEFKGDYWSVESETRLLHPLRDDLTLHFRQEDSGQLVPLSSLGHVYLERLQLNRNPLVAHRYQRLLLARFVEQHERLNRYLTQQEAALTQRQQRYRQWRRNRERG